MPEPDQIEICHDAPPDFDFPRRLTNLAVRRGEIHQ